MPGRGEDSVQFRARMRLRLTDRRVAEVTGRIPLSVSFDKLGATAARWAHLADGLAASGRSVDRTGAGLVAEVYPAAARLRWDLSSTRSISELQTALPCCTRLTSPPRPPTRVTSTPSTRSSLRWSRVLLPWT
jgi:hypothetical protein